MTKVVVDDIIVKAKLRKTIKRAVEKASMEDSILKTLETADLMPYAPVPFWSWNNYLEKEKLIAQIHHMKMAQKERENEGIAFLQEESHQKIITAASASTS